MRTFILALSLLLLAGCSQEPNAATQSEAKTDNTQQLSSQTDNSALTVYKSPTCGCCGGWVDHVQQTGLKTTVIEDADLNDIKNRFGIPANGRSCHTAVQDGFVFEGHIPAKYVKQFLDNPPANASGLIVPGMPIGSPGMEDGDRFNAYTVWQLNKDGSVLPYEQVNSYAQQF